jgi:AcrR family transcriptional regulator
MDNVPRNDKFNERRAELGEAALQTLAELGYARTSLREIAQNSEFSHGVLHYYFTDKVDLILCSVRQYKARCVTRYDEVTVKSTSFDELLEGFARALGDTLRNDATMHRLWYDLRSQSMFEPAFRADVGAIDKSLEKMIWRVMTRLSALAGAPLRAPSDLAYAMFDGLFQRSLLRHLSGDAKAIASLRAGARAIVARLIDVPQGTATRGRKRKQAGAATLPQ